MTDRQARTFWTEPRLDLLLAVGLLGFAWVGLALERGSTTLPMVALVAVIVAPILIRRRWPLGALAVCLATSGVYHLLNYPHAVVLPPLVVILYTVAATGSRQRSLLVAAGTVAVTAVGMVVSGVEGPVEAFGVIGWIALSVALGEVSRVRSVVLAATAERAERAERERAAEAALRRAEVTQREAEARRRLAEERLRIARDLHDVLAHSVAVIHAQASVVSHLDDASPGTSPEGMASAMRAIAETSRNAMHELRATLDVLRGVEPLQAPADELSPAPSLARLDNLVDSVRSTGVDLTVDAAGEHRHLEPAVDVTAYRIIQESLTNVARHAGGGTARLTLEYRPASLRITVCDDGGTATTTTTGDGYGIVGMTERAQAIGGKLRAGPRESGGFEVVADLPTHERNR